MRSFSKKTPYSSASAEKESIQFLMQKMGISKKEIQEIMWHSGVTASKMIELMQLSKYQYVVNENNVPGRCQPCKPSAGRIVVSKFHS